MDCCLRILNSNCRLKKRERACILLDSTDIQVDLNPKCRKSIQKTLDGKEIISCYSPSKGYYIGFKLTMALDYQNLRPLCFILHRSCEHGPKMFTHNERTQEETFNHENRHSQYHKKSRTLYIIKKNFKLNLSRY